MTAGSLAGRRIVVTRRADQAGPLVRLLRARGAEVVEVPATAIGPPEDLRPLDDALGHLEAFDWLVFTSANAVEAVRGRLDALGLAPAVPRLASVGPATTRALATAFPDQAVALQPDRDFRAAGLVNAFQAEGCERARVLIPSSSRARDELSEGLRSLGAEVAAPTAYATTEPVGLRAAVLACVAGGFDAATFAAPSAVQAFAHAAGEAARGLPAAVIGPTTEAAARESGLRVLATAAPSTVEGLVAALEGVLGQSSDPPGA